MAPCSELVRRAASSVADSGSKGSDDVKGASQAASEQNVLPSYPPHPNARRFIRSFIRSRLERTCQSRSR